MAEVISNYEIIDSTQSDPLVSVAMLSYNHAKYINEAVESILNQKVNFQIQIVIADDYSTDATRDILKKNQLKHPNLFKLIFQSENVGPTQNNIDLLTNLDGKFIAALEGDDYWIDDYKLQKQVDFLNSKRKYQFCFTRFKTYRQDLNTFQEDVNGKYFSKESYINIDFKRLQTGWHMGTQTLLFRRESLNLETIKNFSLFRDMHIITQLLKKGKGACLNFFGAVYRIHDAGIHSTLNNYEKIELGYLVYKEIYEDNPSNKFLKERHLRSLNDYIISLIKSRRLLKALKMSFKFLIKNGDVVLFLKFLKRITLKRFN